MNPLLFIPSPRDIPEVKESVDKLKIDKIWIKYYGQEEAYKTARQYFLEHKEYTHLVIHPDDLLVTPLNLEYLLIDRDMVIYGWCINTIREDWQQLNQSNISDYLSYEKPREATYESFQFMPVERINDLLRNGIAKIKVKFAGFALTSIPRNVVEQVPFIADGDCCMDSTFALDLDAHGIEQYVNIRVRTKQIRRISEEIQTGKKEKRIIFEGK